MMHDASEAGQLIQEGAIGMAAAGRFLGECGGRPRHSVTMTRCCLRGWPLADGTRICLEHYKLNGRLFTSKPAILRFIARQNEPITPSPATVPQSAASRNRAALAAGRELDAMGV